MVEVFSASETAEQRLLAVVSTPWAVGATVREIAAKAGVSQMTYYRMQKRPDFVAREKVARRALLGRIERQVEALRETAEDPENPGQVAAARLLWEFGGHIDSARSQVNIQINNTIIEAAGLPSDEEMLWVYEALGVPREKWQARVRERADRGEIAARMPAELSDAPAPADGPVLALPPVVSEDAG